MTKPSKSKEPTARAPRSLSPSAHSVVWSPDEFRSHLTSTFTTGLALSAALGMSRPIGCAILRGSQVPSSRALDAIGYEWVIRRKTSA